MSGPHAERTAPDVPPAQRRAVGGAPPARSGLFGAPAEEDDLPLPDLPPLPADPRWRIEHLPLVTAAGLALVCCAGSVGFLAGGPSAGLGAALGVFVVAVGLTMSTLAIAWADVVRPALVLPVGLLAYVIKFALIAFIMVGVAGSGWSGGRPMAWGIVAGAVLLTAVQVWWVTRLARRHLPDRPVSR